MVNAVFNLDFYKIPQNETLQNRIEFYDMKRGTGETIEQWLNRVQNTIICCDLPANIIQFLLIDRFICGLNKTEMDVIRSAGTWSIMQLLARFSDKTRDDSEQLATNKGTVSENGNTEEVNISINTTTAESNAIEYNRLNIRPRYKSDEENTFAMMMSNTYMTGEEAIRLDGEDGTPNNNGKSVTNERIDMPLDCEMDEYNYTLYEPICQIDEVENRFDRPIEQQVNENRLQCQPNMNNSKKSYTCGACNESFNRLFELTHHSKVIHAGIRSYPCDRCEKSYNQLGNLCRHKRMVHPCVCAECGKRFNLSSHLKMHSYIHSGRQYRYSCDQCFRSFTQPSSLNAHKKAIHQQFRFNCDECEKSFTYLSNLRRHKRVNHQSIRSQRFNNLEMHPDATHIHQNIAAEKKSLHFMKKTM